MFVFVFSRRLDAAFLIVLAPVSGEEIEHDGEDDDDWRKALNGRVSA
jgi:hypothetical protein